MVLPCLLLRLLNVSVTGDYLGLAFDTHKFTVVPDDSFSALVKLIDENKDGVLNLTHGYHYYEDYDSKYAAGIEITKDLVINAVNCTIDARYMARIFNIVGSSVDVTLNSLTMINANSTGQGGAITSTGGDLNIFDCIFENCTANNGQSNGGAISSSGNSLVIRRSKFNNCIGNRGGAVYYSQTSPSSYVEVHESNFTNIKGQNGAALYANADSSIIVDDCMVINNTNRKGVTSPTGVFYLKTSVTNGINVLNSYFENNTLTASGSTGGALYLDSSYSVINCIFVDNSAKSYGGAIYSRTDGKIVNSTFLNNTGDSTIYVSSGNVNITGCLFLENKPTTLRGSVLHVNAGNGYVGDSIILNNGNQPFTANGYIYLSYMNHYNWFGNNASNWNVRLVTISNNVGLTKWLYLDSPSHNDVHVLPVNETTRIYYSLNHWANTTHTGVYDASKLPSVVFDTNVTSGNIISNASRLNDGLFYVDYLPTQYGYVNITVNYSTGSYTLKINIVPDDSFSALQSLINQTVTGVLNLTHGYKYYEDIDDEYINGLTINKNNLTINAVNCTIDAKGIARIFTDINMSNIVINNITFKNNNMTRGNLTINGVNVTVQNSGLHNITVLVGEAASVYLINNTELNAFNDNWNVVVNNGTLYLSKNRFVNAIYNTPSGLITSGVVVTVMGNKTYIILPMNQNVNATIWDDNRNPIRVDDYKIYTANVLNPKVNYTAKYSNGHYYVNGLIVIEGNNTLTSEIVDTSRYSNITYKGALLIASWQAVNTTINLTCDVVDNRVIIQVNITPRDAPGNITYIFIDSIEYNITLTNATGILNLSSTLFDVGFHSVIAYYPAYQLYSGSIASGNFTITTNRNATINITADNIKDGSPALINVTLPRDATGTVIIRINGTNYTKEFTMGLVNGSVLLTVPGLAIGSYNVTVEYLGDINYMNGTNVTKFNVTSRFNTTIEFNMSTNYMFNTTIHVNATTNVTNATFIIYIDGISHGNVTAVNNTIEFDITDVLMPGNHSVALEYLGDVDYYALLNATWFIVDKLDSPLNINTTVESGVVVINVTVNETAEGNVLVKVNGTDYSYIAPVVNGSAVLTIRNLSPGQYNVTVTYTGDDLFITNSTVMELTVPYNNIDVAVNDGIVYGMNATVTVYVPDTFTGNVTIFVDGNEYGNATINTTTHTAVLNVTGLNAGMHNVTAEYNGTTGFAIFNVARANATMNVTVDDIVVIGQNATVNISSNVAYGNVTVYINGNRREIVLVNTV